MNDNEIENIKQAIKDGEHLLSISKHNPEFKCRVLTVMDTLNNLEGIPSDLAQKAHITCMGLSDKNSEVLDYNIIKIFREFDIFIHKGGKSTDYFFARAPLDDFVQTRGLCDRFISHFEQYIDKGLFVKNNPIVYSYIGELIDQLKKDSANKSEDQWLTFKHLDDALILGLQRGVVTRERVAKLEPVLSLYYKKIYTLEDKYTLIGGANNMQCFNGYKFPLSQILYNMRLAFFKGYKVLNEYHEKMMNYLDTKYKNGEITDKTYAIAKSSIQAGYNELRADKMSIPDTILTFKISQEMGLSWKRLLLFSEEEASEAYLYAKEFAEYFRNEDILQYVINYYNARIGTCIEDGRPVTQQELASCYIKTLGMLKDCKVISLIDFVKYKKRIEQQFKNI